MLPPKSDLRADNHRPINTPVAVTIYQSGSEGHPLRELDNRQIHKTGQVSPRSQYWPITTFSVTLSGCGRFGVAFLMSQPALVSPGRFVILLHGRHAGKKALVLTAYPAGDSRKYPYCVVLGIERGPKSLTKEMPEATLVKRTQVKCFVKTINCNHLLLTRHILKDDDLMTKVDSSSLIKAMEDPGEKKEALRNAGKILRQKFLNNKLPWFFKPLQF
jgi:large subunit ribosomal protein L27e